MTDQPDLPNYRRTEEQANRSGWYMVDGNPEHWIHIRTNEELFGLNYKKPKQEKKKK